MNTVYVCLCLLYGRPSVGQHLVQFAADFQRLQLHEAADGLFSDKNLGNGALT